MSRDASIRRWAAIALLVATGLANLWLNWTAPTPWTLDCCFGPQDGQPLGLPVALIHLAVALLIAVPRYARMGVALGIGWAALGALAWASLTVWRLVLVEGGSAPPSRANGSWTELLILPAMLLAYLAAFWLLWIDARRVITSRHEGQPA